MLSPELKLKVEEWLKWDRNENTRNVIKRLLDDENEEKLQKMLLKRIQFGTAGLRGKMEAGYCSMNDLVIIQTGQGVLRYLLKTESELVRKNGIVVGYDGRHNSKRWAELTATIFTNAGITVRLFGEVTPTPFVPFSVRKYNLAMGIMITASHNPKDDNGYKVYASNGAQIVNPADKLIQSSILEKLEPDETSWETHLIQDNNLIIDPLEEVTETYIKNIKNDILPEHLELNKKMNVMFTYTAMHGVGYRYIKKLFDAIQIKFKAVPEQKDPHPDFPTVDFPNPEEGASSLNLSFSLADKIGSDVILANDPDADRLACAERNKSGKWKIFSGNELGALLGWWLLQCYKSKNPKKDLSDVYMISSTVSSMILKSMAKREAFNFVDTLTGFKWIGNKAIDLTKRGKDVIFCFEEAIGFLCDMNVIDKDGVSAAYQLSTLVSFLKSEGKTLADQLEEIYNTYGAHISLNSYYICHQADIIKAIFERIRNFNGPNSYPMEFLNGKYIVENVRDLTTGHDSSQPDKKAVLPVDPSTQMITLYFSNGLICTLRTSGTEPKIKYYTEMCASPEEKDKAKIKNNMEEQVNVIIEKLLQPVKNKLISKSV